MLVRYGRSASYSATGLWEELETDWVVLDCELMPWSFKAQELLSDQYAPVGTAARSSLGHAKSLLRQASERGVNATDPLAKVQEWLGLAQLYCGSYARYWPVQSLADIQVAPFHVLASEGQLHSDKDHLWHMDMASRLHESGPSLFRDTLHRVVQLNTADESDATRWWEELTLAGGEGMVVKPVEFVSKGNSGLVQPAMKCRGAEYLRIIYGPEYTLPENLERLRNRKPFHKEVAGP